MNYVVKKSLHAEDLRVALDRRPGSRGRERGPGADHRARGEEAAGLDLAGLLDVIEAEMMDAPDRLQWAMNHCLAQIGIDHAEHRARAVDIGERLEVLADHPTRRAARRRSRPCRDRRDRAPAAGEVAHRSPARPHRSRASSTATGCGRARGCRTRASSAPRVVELVPAYTSNRPRSTRNARRVVGPEPQVLLAQFEGDRGGARPLQSDALEAAQPAHRLRDARRDVVDVELDDLVARTLTGVGDRHPHGDPLALASSRTGDLVPAEPGSEVVNVV